ncbi:MAG: transketolase C-terminal domain-containing protein [Candidatus Micrarchaeia archaeon]
MVAINSKAKLVPDVLNPAEKSATRDGAGKGLVEAGEKDANVVALAADLSESVRTHWFEQKFPERFFQAGVAEQNLAGVAAGLGMAGKAAFIGSFAAFSPGRNFDQIRVPVCYNNSNVKILGSHTGLTVGEDGATHQMMEDIAMMRALPNMKVVVPSDAVEAKKAVLAAAKDYGPYYIRLTREKVPTYTTPETPFEVGKAIQLAEGKDISLFGCGTVAYDCLKAAYELEKQGISAAVYDFHTVKPIDREAVIKAAKETGLIMTVEEHQVSAGFGSAVCEVAAQESPCRIVRHGMPDSFGESGAAKDLLKKYRLDAQGIYEKALEAAKGK